MKEKEAKHEETNFVKAGGLDCEAGV
jgi:hypothetical protein